MLCTGWFGCEVDNCNRIVQVEFNYSKHNIVEQPKNTYWLGSFQNHESSDAFCNHHCSFRSIGSFHIQFFSQNLILKHTCIDSWIFNLKARDNNDQSDLTELSWTHKNGKQVKLIFTNQHNQVCKMKMNPVN